MADPEMNDDGLIEDGSEEISHGNGEMTNRLKRLEENQAALNILADPDVRSVLEAKKAGRKVKLVDDVPEPKDPEPSLVDDIPKDDPIHETLTKIDQLIEKRLENRTKPLLERLAQMEQIGAEVQKKDVQQQVTVARNKYKDLDQFKHDMVELSKTNPTLGVEDLYILSKHRAGKLRQAEQNTHSEKPTQQPRRSVNDKPGKKVERPQGRRGFTELLGESLTGLSIDDIEK